MKISAAVGLAAALVIGSLTESANAQGPVYGYWNHSPYYLNYSDNHIPYFSLYPPVYYKYPPVPRSYGHSPFAYPPGHITPDVETVEAQVMINPYVPKNEAGPPKANDSLTSGPLMISNPFVSGGESRQAGEPAKSIYPVSGRGT